MTDQPRGLQTDLMKCSRETRQYVLGLGAEIEQLRSQLERGKTQTRADIVDQFMGLTLADYRTVVEERDELLIQKRVLLDAIDSWKQMNTVGRRERDVARMELRLLRQTTDGNYWSWMPDEHENHIESLTCPVVIHPEDLRNIVRERDEALAEIERLRAENELLRHPGHGPLIPVDDDSDLLHYHNKPVGWGDGEPEDWEQQVEAGIPLTREELDDMEDRGR